MRDFQAYVKVDVAALPEEDKNTAIQNYLLRMGAVGADELTDEEILEFPLVDVADLVKEILKFSGVNTDAAPNV